ncbi:MULTISPECIES: N-acetylglutaminylglutamine synthetase [Rhodomicrobium]|uniref:N-acetylglutaminylglutamine synthetase n=1 Tax=Rhodomicrobium TaxID=1068 RepID=UPI000B4AB2E8|nr:MULTISPECIES: N-acetylglutaminylglutamine synthetase [Rhodomicrobium]
MRKKSASRQRARRLRAQSVHAYRPWRRIVAEGAAGRPNAMVDCGWGRLLFGETFADPRALSDALGAEGPDRRDIAFHISDPHVLLSAAPRELFLDPSHTYRLDLTMQMAPMRRREHGFFLRRLVSQADADAVNRIYLARSMVPVPPEFFWSNRGSRAVTVLVAEDEQTGQIIGTVMGVDHHRAMDDPECGSSLWCLAVDPQAQHARIGEALVRRLADHFRARAASYMDLSVLHDNSQAIALYEKLGFRRVPLFCVKRKNPINERLFIGASPAESLNPYATIIVNEAMRRGIQVEVTDAEGGFFRLVHGSRSVHCRESLSELTSGVAVSICDDKTVTRRVVARAGVRVPEQMQIAAGTETDEEIEAFLQAHPAVVVKPARGEQGQGVSVGLTTLGEVRQAAEAARAFSSRIIIEQMVEGSDLRLIVIDYRVVAAAIRRPPHIVGDGAASIRALIEAQSRRRSAATQGESAIPIDAETERCIGREGFSLDDILPAGTELQTRKTANLHTGGTIHDVTDELHPRLAEAAIAAARAIDIPVTGIDFIVENPRFDRYAFIEANERPGLANHEPQPTAERFIDLLFPLSIPAPVRAVRQNQEAQL